MSKWSPQPGAPGPSYALWVLTHLAGGYHLQTLLVCPDATSGTQVSLVEGTPVWGRVGGEVGRRSLDAQPVITIVTGLSWSIHAPKTSALP